MKARFDLFRMLFFSYLIAFSSTELLGQSKPTPVIVFANGWMDCCTWNFSEEGDAVAETAARLGMIFHRTSWDSFKSESTETGLIDVNGTVRFVSQGVDYLNSLPTGTDVYLIGHSFGGDSLLTLVSAYHRKNVNIRLLAVVDPVGLAGLRSSLDAHTVEDSVEYFHNIWQQNEPFPNDFTSDGAIKCNAHFCDQRENNFRRYADGTNMRHNCTWLEVGCEGRVENPMESKPGWKLQRTRHQDITEDDFVSAYIAQIISNLAAHEHPQVLAALDQSFFEIFSRNPTAAEKSFIAAKLAERNSQAAVVALLQRTRDFFVSLKGIVPSPAEFLWFNANIKTKSETVLRSMISSSLSSSPVFVGDVTANYGELYGSFNAEAVPLGTFGWRYCPSNSTLAGEDQTPYGFWTCLNNQNSNRNIVIGDVEQDVGYLQIVNKMHKVSYGTAGWNHCPVGSLLFRKYDSNGFWVCLSEPLPTSAEVIIGDVRNNIGYRYAISGSKGLFLDTAGWNSCPSGYTYIGNNLTVEGFWLCVRNDLNNRKFIVGDVVNNAGSAYQLYNGSSIAMGSMTWNSCPTGALLGTDYHANGFWVCKGDIVYTGPDAYIGDVRNNYGHFYSVQNNSVGYLGGAGWNYCPAGYQLVGTSFHSNGFWLCARPDLVSRAFFVGDVTNNSGPAYMVQNGSVSYWGGYSWNSCPFGSLIGTYFDSNGFWICRQ